MKNSLLSAAVTLAVSLGTVGGVPLANAAANDSTNFTMVRSAGAGSRIQVHCSRTSRDQRPGRSAEPACRGLLTPRQHAVYVVCYQHP